MTEQEIWRRARHSRDPRFDGRFFIAVTSTRIYCRPICPVHPPKERNVIYFPTAAAAAEAGFRPCLRCRPETAPGTPAWAGTSSTVSRALRLIGESALDDGGVDDLAGRLGIGSRHLRRLFLQHLGATPVAVAQTRRLHFAKRLIDETDLPFSEIAMAAGFGSIRRFNATFQNLYKRTPTHLRRLAHRKENDEPGSYRFLLRYRAPFDWDALLEFLAARAIAGVEVVENGAYRRTIFLDGKCGHFEARLSPKKQAVELCIEFPEPRALYRIVDGARRLFDLGADPGEVAEWLSRDEMLAPRLIRRPGLRVPGAWDGFELAIRAILGQQVTVKGASTLAGRIVRAYGTPIQAAGGLTHVFPSATVLADADFRQIGLPGARIATLRALSRAVALDEIRFSGIVDSSQFMESLQRLPGVGAWTAQYIAMRALGEPDAFPVSDLGLLRSAGIKGARELALRSERWRPWRAYAAMYLWQGGQSNAGSIVHTSRQSGRAAVVSRGPAGIAAHQLP